MGSSTLQTLRRLTSRLLKPKSKSKPRAETCGRILRCEPLEQRRLLAMLVSNTVAGGCIMANNQTKVYGAALPALTVSYSGFVNGDNASSLTRKPRVSTTATAASHVAGGPYSVTAGGAADPNYSFTYVAGTLAITRAPLTITVANQSMILGDMLPPLTSAYTGLVNGDTPARLSASAVLSTTATSQSPAGTYPINVSFASSDYKITQVSGTITVIRTLAKPFWFPIRWRRRQRC